jgi:hypothetical protein
LVGSNPDSVDTLTRQKQLLLESPHPFPEVLSSQNRSGKSTGNNQEGLKIPTSPLMMIDA